MHLHVNHSVHNYMHMCASSTTSFEATLRAPRAFVFIHTSLLFKHFGLTRFHLSLPYTFRIKHVLGGCGGGEPSHYKSKSIASCSETAKDRGLKESLVAVEQIVGGAEDEKRSKAARNREEGVHHICRPRPCAVMCARSWEGELQHHGCVAKRQDEHVAVRKLRVSLFVEHRRVPCAKIRGKVFGNEIVSVSADLAVERSVVDAELAGVGIRRQ